MKTEAIIVAVDDRDRLVQLVHTLRGSSFRDEPQLDLLDGVLQSVHAMAFEQVPADVIRMNSRFRILDLDTGKALRYKLVFPQDADISTGRVSILAPVGAAVFGRRRGEVIEAKVPGGCRRLKIENVSHPRTNGRKHTRPSQRIATSGHIYVGRQSNHAAA